LIKLVFSIITLAFNWFRGSSFIFLV